MRNLLIAIVAINISACSQTYSVSEEKINTTANEKIAEYQQKRPLNFAYKASSVKLDIKHINIDLQERNGGMVSIRPDVDINTSIRIFGKTLQKSLYVQPVFNSNLTYSDGEFLLENVTLDKKSLIAKSPIEAEVFKYFDQLSIYIEKFPVYRLDHNLKEKIGAQIVSKMVITDSELLFD